MRICLLLVVALWSAVGWAAAPACHRYSVTWSSRSVELVAPEGEHGAICQMLADAHIGRTGVFSGVGSGVIIDATGTNVPYTGYPYGRCSIEYTAKEIDGEDTSVVTTTSSPISRHSGTEECPPDACSEFQGVSTVLNGQGALPMSACHAIGGQLCQFSAAGVGVGFPTGAGWSARMAPTGESCSLADDISAMGDCMMTASGKYACAATESQPNCGEVNGQAVCLDKIPDGGCMFLGDGGMVCGSDAPAPDNGTPGEAAQPDFSFTMPDGEGGTTEVNYYGPTTVSGSSNGGEGTPGVRPGGAGVGTGDGDGEGDGYEEGDAGTICEGGDCYGSLPLEVESCADDFAGCIGTYGAALWDTVESLPMIAFIGDLHEAFGTAGACPVVNMSMLGETYDLMAPVCAVTADHAALMHLLFQIVWSLAGLKVILEA